MAEDDVPEPIKMRILAERESKHNTGVKGVLADYKASLQMNNAKQIAEEENRMAILMRIAKGSTRVPDNATLNVICFRL